MFFNDQYLHRTYTGLPSHFYSLRWPCTGACHYFTSTTVSQQKIRTGNIICGRQYRAQEPAHKESYWTPSGPWKFHYLSSLICSKTSTLLKVRVKISISQQRSLKRPYSAKCDNLWSSWRQEAHCTLVGVCLSLSPHIIQLVCLHSLF